MLRNNDGLSHFLQALDDFKYIQRSLRIQLAGGLIDHHNVGIQNQNRGKCNSLTLSSGQRQGVLLQKMIHFHQLGDFQDPLNHFLPLYPQVLQAHADFLKDGFLDAADLGKGILENIANPHAQVGFVPVLQLLAVYNHSPPQGAAIEIGAQPPHQIAERRFTAGIGADDAVAFSRLQLAA